jgi:hypothetical protein
MKKIVLGLILGLLWCDYLMAACAVVNGKEYGDCSGVKVNVIPYDSNPAVLNGHYSDSTNSDAIVKNSATVSGMVTGNIKIEKKR